jgi:hypothetical protein
MSEVRYIAQSKELAAGVYWGVYDLQAQMWTSRYKDGTPYGGISLSLEDAEAAAARMNDEQELPGVDPVSYEDDE